MENKKYQLYVGKIQDIPKDVKYSYYNDREHYILIYTDMEVPNTFKTVGDEYLNTLSAEESKWLTTAKMRINSQYVQEHINDFQGIMSSFITELEKELKLQQEKIVEEKGN